MPSEISKSPNIAVDSARLEWMTRYASGLAPSSDVSNAMAVDASGNSFDDVHNTLMLIKYSPDGSQQWVARPRLCEVTDNWMGSVVLDSAANILVNATYSGSLRTTAFSSSGSEGRTAGFVYSGVFAFDRRGRMHVSGATGTGSQSTIITALYSLSSLTPPIEPLLVSIKSSLSQNFPDPFNGSTIINF